jgi:chaperonin GroEL
VAEIMENKNPSWGYNAATGEFVDMFKQGIIDPTKVARTALQNAASAIGLALTTDVLVTELKEKKGEEAKPVAGAVA